MDEQGQRRCLRARTAKARLFDEVPVALKLTAISHLGIAGRELELRRGLDDWWQCVQHHAPVEAVHTQVLASLPWQPGPEPPQPPTHRRGTGVGVCMTV